MHLISGFVIYSGYFLHVNLNSNLSLSNSLPFPGSEIPKRNVLDRAQHQEFKQRAVYLSLGSVGEGPPLSSLTRTKTRLASSA